MNEIVVPRLPPPPVELELAFTCEGKVEHPKGERPTCARCTERLERYRHVAAGNGTVEEIREALSALETLKGQPPLGECVRVDWEGVRVWACPRAINVGTDDDPTPLTAVAANRAQRRAMKMRHRR